MGQDPTTHGGQPFGQKYLALNNFGTDQGWSNAQTPRLVGDVSGDGIPDIVGFGANSTFTALGSHNSSGQLIFTMDPSATINDYGFNEGWSEFEHRPHAGQRGRQRNRLPRRQRRLQHLHDQVRIRRVVRILRP